MAEKPTLETIQKDLEETLEIVEKIVYDLLPTRGDRLNDIQTKSATLALHANDFGEETEEKTEPTSWSVLARKIKRKTVSLVQFLFKNILIFLQACWTYLTIICKPSTHVPDSL